MCKYLGSASEKSFAALAVSAALLVGILVRFPYLISDDLFPLGDGGLFVAIINSIKANRYILPEFVVYNRVEIPFAYPPFGFYLAIFVSRSFGLPTLFMLRLLPIVFNLLTIVVFVLLAIEILKDRKSVLAASVIFPLIMQTYLWTIKGGGISRSPGFFFTALSVYLICLYQRRENRCFLAAALVSLSAAVLSHPEWAVVALASIGVLFLPGRHRDWKRRILLLLSLYVGTAVLTAPWWVTVLARFGLSPFLMASQVARLDLSRLLTNFVTGKMLSVDIIFLQDYFISLFALIGMGISFYKRNFLLPVWLTVVYFVAPKNSPISGLIPLALLFAVGLHFVNDLLLSGLRFLKDRRGVFGLLSRSLLAVFSFLPPGGLYLVVVIWTGTASLIDRPVLRPINQSDRAAMQFIAKNTSPDARFVVMTPSDWFEADAAEWFPLLADRQSLTTPQGLEWVSASEFVRVGRIAGELSSLVRSAARGNDSGEIVRYVETHFEEFEYVVVFANDLDGTFGGFLETGRFELIYLKNNVLIFSRIPAQDVR